MKKPIAKRGGAVMTHKEKIEKQVREKIELKYSYAKFWGYDPKKPSEKEIQREIRRKMLANNLL